jgi:histidine triad (HIT) family protein
MCIFCKIIAGEIPSYRIFEDEDFVAFLDISQATIGHTLLLPKKHVATIYELDSPLQEKLGKALVTVARLLKEKLGFEDLNILNNNGPLAGQTIAHFHVHLIPRYSTEELGFHLKPHSLTPEEFKELQRKILA